MFLRFLVHNQPKKWLEMLPWVEFWHNSTFNVSIGMSGFLTLYGRDATSFTKFYKEEFNNLPSEEELSRRQKIIEIVKINMDRAKEYMKNRVDRGRTTLN